MPGMGELLVILVIVLLIFGAGKLPAIGDSLGRSIKNFKRASNGEDEIEVSKKKAVGGAAAKELKAKAAAELEDDIAEAEVVRTKAKAARDEG